MATRAFLCNESMKYAIWKLFYEKRLTRIIVDAPKEVVVWISRMENIETQAAMKSQPYVEILKHARGQWLAYSKPQWEQVLKYLSIMKVENFVMYVFIFSYSKSNYFDIVF